MALRTEFHRSLRAILGESHPTLVDVGASRGIHPRWAQFGEFLNVVGFEPNPEEFRKLPASPKFRWVQAAVAGQKGRRTLYLTRRFNNSSLFLPNKSLIEELEWGDGFDVVREEQIDCVSLDEALSEDGIQTDFLKLDTQGSELEILRGGSRLLDSELVQIEVEVEFCPLYENQPLFADVDAELRSRGFYLHDMANHLFVKPRGMRGIGGPKGRLNSADALYFREPKILMEWTDAKLGATLVAYVAYGFPDAALHLLKSVEAGGRRLPAADVLSQSLREFRHRSYWLNWLPGRSFLSRCAKRFHLDFRPVEHSLWENELGNRLT